MCYRHHLSSLCLNLQSEVYTRVLALNASAHKASLEITGAIKFALLKPPIALGNYEEKGSQAQIFAVKMHPLALTLSWVWWGRCEKNYLPKEEGREGGEKKRAQRARRARGSNPGPAAC